MAEKRNEEQEMLKGHDEWNAASLNFIPAQERLPEDMLRLERMVTRPNGHPAKIVCVGTPGVGLARGNDNDLLVALINTYIDAGCPIDGVINTTAYALLKLIGVDTSGHYYEGLSQSIDRVFNTTFHITDGWFDFQEGRYTTVSFRIIDNLTRTHRSSQGNAIALDSRSVLRIRLNEELTKSIRNGYIKPLNLTLYQTLPTVGSRNMYRMLDAYKDQAESRGEPMPYTVNLSMMTAAQNCGILTPRPDNVRRALERMHAPLLEQKYLASVDFIGKGAKTRVHYTFPDTSRPISTADPELVALLTERGVHTGRAIEFVQSLGDKIHPAVQKFDTKLKEKQLTSRPIKDKGAYMAKLLDEAVSIARDAEAAAEQARAPQRTTRTAPDKAVKKVAVQTPLFDEEHDANLQERLKALDPELAFGVVLPPFRITMLQARGVSLQDMDTLRARFVSGHFTVDELRKVTNAIMFKESDAVSALHSLLGNTP